MVVQAQAGRDGVCLMSGLMGSQFGGGEVLESMLLDVVCCSSVKDRWTCPAAIVGFVRLTHSGRFPLFATLVRAFYSCDLRGIGMANRMGRHLQGG